MSLANYKTTINGTVVQFNYLFDVNASRVNIPTNVRAKFKIGGVLIEPTSTLQSFSNTGDTILATNSTTTHREWGYNQGQKIYNHWGFNDMQKNVGYKTSGNDIGPKCCARFIDYVATGGTTGAIYVPSWVDYFNVIAVGEGGINGDGRDTDDEHSQGKPGSSGGMIAWKSPVNLGTKTNWFYKVAFGAPLANGTAEFQLHSSTAGGGSALNSKCTAYKGFKAGNITGNDGDDTHHSSRRATGFDEDDNYLTFAQGGTTYGQRFITGRPSSKSYWNSNPSDNLIAESVHGWNSFGRGEDWKHRNHSGAMTIGSAAVRVYYIAYNVVE